MLCVNNYHTAFMQRVKTFHTVFTHCVQTS